MNQNKEASKTNLAECVTQVLAQAQNRQGDFKTFDFLLLSVKHLNLGE
ncbi:MAG: hypothetical protein WCT45_02790 [Candidatus Paceibacterota bacterium]